MKQRSYLALEGIGVTFPTPKGPFTALRDIDLSIDKGEFVALIGHSGCCGMSNSLRSWRTAFQVIAAGVSARAIEGRWHVASAAGLLG